MNSVTDAEKIKGLQSQVDVLEEKLDRTLHIISGMLGGDDKVADSVLLKYLENIKENL